MAVVCCLGMKKNLLARGALRYGYPVTPVTPVTPRVCVFLGSYIYSRLIILYIINLLSFYTETWRGTEGTGVTAGQRITKKRPQHIGMLRSFFSYLCWNAYSSVVVHLQHIYAILVELLACCKFVY